MLNSSCSLHWSLSEPVGIAGGRNGHIHGGSTRQCKLYKAYEGQFNDNLLYMYIFTYVYVYMYYEYQIGNVPNYLHVYIYIYGIGTLNPAYLYMYADG